MKTSQENLRVTFYLKRNVTRNGLCPVMGRITIGKDMVQFSCKLDADPNLWDTRAGRVNGKSDHARSVNRKIDKVNVTIHARYREIVSLKGTATPVEVKEAFQGIASSQVGLLELFHEHNEEYKKRVGVNRAISTWWNYRNLYNHLERFIIQKYHVRDIPVRQLDHAFIENYDFYLRIDCRQISGTIISRMTHLRKIANIAVKRAVINRDPFADYIPERPKTQQRYLPREELKKMMTATFDRPQLDFVRDMFVFASFTGLSFSDMRNLTNDQIVKESDGSLWLKVNRQKTNTPSNVPLLDVPKNIIDKYRGLAKDNKTFPMINCGITNKYLKEIARQCGIERRLTFHMSRHTITIDGNVAQFSLKEDAHPNLWDAGKGRIKGKSREDIALNRKIDQTEQTIRDIYVRTLDAYGYVTAARLKNELTGVDSKTETLLKLFEEHNLEYEKRVGIDRKKGSYYIYTNDLRHLSRFIKSKYGLDDYPLKQLEESFIRDFDFYLRVDCGISTGTILRHIIHLKKVVNRAIRQGHILCDPFADFVPENPR